MAFILGKGFVDLDLDDDKFTRGLSGVGGRLNKLQGRLETIAGVAKRVLLGAAAAAGGSIALAAAQERADAKLAAVLKATGNAAGFTTDQLKAQAAALQELTGIEDDVVQNTQAILLTFKKVKGDEFERATKAALDLSEVMETDLKSSALQLGKALEDPTKGMTALTRSGVSFTKAQQDQIKALQSSGRLLEAQGMILEAVEGQVSGVAEEINKGLTGSLRAMKNAVGDAAEEVGFSLLPAIQSLRDIVVPLTKDIGTWISNNKKLTASLIGVTIAASTLLIVLPLLTGAVTKLSVAMAFLAKNPIILVASAIVTLVTIVGSLLVVLNRANETGQSFGDTLGEIGELAAFAFTNIGTLLSNIMAVGRGISGVFGQKIATAIDAIGRALSFFGATTMGREFSLLAGELRSAGEDLEDEAAGAIGEAIGGPEVAKRIADFKKKLADLRRIRGGAGGGGGGGGTGDPAGAAASTAANAIVRASDAFSRLSTASPAKVAEKQRAKSNELLDDIKKATEKTVKEIQKGVPAKFSK